MTATQLRKRRLEALGNLLEAFAEPGDHRCRWAYRCQLGDAGSVLISVDVYPQRLSTATRDSILSTAARLVNWSHP
ncbi:hypothetical protein [Mycolicibacterium fortuitum]|uniref:Uncharacterized protein n=1 Tax=Mycolicibacterium fortuitum TaxID=1766 RepID=A0AAE4VD77_MYCFO|nr:hypothetical protein [Mycolicibacterium fortuitum]MDV7192624.1 hypothetical protein [Mycolicibacterium fortuitum]MDV7205525.1 hypothetical protein [Mycolicibacterium fortuitum]MDV7227106.1 hypothetical protein [Mycolicibacterium fortuitum]MDV7259649.1 hypothetical protein [Mycolicibacterium fortuitum]MDV7286212.1 hypothetical protein [Mycolicibacterium fortuitum]